jgi:hypothetical protein
MKKTLLFVFTSIILIGCGESEDNRNTSATVPEQVTQSPATTTKEFQQVINDITRDWLRASPESASSLGVSEEIAGGPYIARLGQTGLAAREETMRLLGSFIKRLESLDINLLNAQQQQIVEIQLFRYR